MHSFVKIKSSRIGEITLSFTDIGKSRPCHEFLMSKICVLTLFAKISKFTVYSNIHANKFYLAKLTKDAD